MVLKESAFLWTDGRYVLQANKQCDPSIWKVMQTMPKGGANMPEHLAEILPPSSKVRAAVPLFNNQPPPLRSVRVGDNTPLNVIGGGARSASTPFSFPSTQPRLWRPSSRQRATSSLLWSPTRSTHSGATGRRHPAERCAGHQSRIARPPTPPGDAVCFARSLSSPRRGPGGRWRTNLGSCEEGSRASGPRARWWQRWTR